MTSFESTIFLFLGSIFGGILGALSGLGGGIIVIPLLVLGAGVDIHYAIGASLIAVIATSTGTSAAYVKDGYSNIRLGMFLETATCTGALLGVAIGSYLPAHVLLILFALLLIGSSLVSFFKKIEDVVCHSPDRLASALSLNSAYPVKNLDNSLSYSAYYPQNIPYTYGMMILAGILSGGLGLGAGTLKVIALDQMMCLPFKVSTTTSNFMIGVTAATSAGLYFALGYIDPFLTAPVVVGITVGSLVGAHLLVYLPVEVLRKLFASILLVVALQIIYKVFSSV